MKEPPNTPGQISEETSKTSACRIIAIGDSLTAGYNLESKDTYPTQLETLLREHHIDCSVVNA